MCVLVGEPDRLTRDTRAFLKLYREAGEKPVEFDPDDKGLERAVLSADLIVDAIYGIGFHGELSGKAMLAAKLINRSKAPVVSADLPSGTGADSALVSEDCIKADYTVTFYLSQAGPLHTARQIVLRRDIGVGYRHSRQLIDKMLSEPSGSLSGWQTGNSLMMSFPYVSPIPIKEITGRSWSSAAA